MEQRFAGKVLVVTGCASGIGRGIAERALAEGAKVAAIDIAEEALEEVYGGNENVLCLACNVADYDQVQRAIEQVVERFGRIDVLMNNAGAQSKSIDDEYSMLKCPPDVWRRVMDVNATGAFFVGQACARQMVAQGEGGAIVNTCSNAVVKTYPNGGAYGPSKAALTKMTYIWAKELTPYGIRVNGFAPGTTKTNFTKMIWQDEKANQAYLDNMPLHRYGTPEDMAALALFLASDEASFIVGEVYGIDGGQHL